MRRRISRRVVALATVLVAVASGRANAGDAPGTGAPAARAPWEGYANAWIAAHAQRVKGDAPREFRKSCEGDVNGDGHADVVVIYSIEGVGGGNDWTQYATVLTSTAQGYGASAPKEVGGKSVRAVEGCAIDGRTITLDLLTYGPKDGSCCPSVPRKTRYTFEKGVLAPVPEPAPSAT